MPPSGGSAFRRPQLKLFKNGAPMVSLKGERIRPPAVAGTFYPGEPSVLQSQIQELLDTAPSSQNIPKAVIAPHAGYIYSGLTAAHAYKPLLLNSHKIKRVVLLGPAHRVHVFGLAAPAVDYFSTPLGNIQIDQAAIEGVIQKYDYVQKLDRAHIAEHSLEVHLPFLQVVLDEFILIPFVVGEASTEQVGAVLNALWGGDETLIVISSDLSHFHDYATAKQLDLKTAESIESFAGEQLSYESACGRNPIKGLLNVAPQHQLSIHRLDLRNSGDTAGSKDRVVGYGSWLLYSSY